MRTDGPWHIVLNAGSGGVDGDTRAALITRRLRKARRGHRLATTRDPRQLRTLAREAIAHAQREDGIVVVAGGDGTINAVASEVLPSGLPFGILAQGTFNFTGRCHGIPEDTARAVDALLEARVRPVQVGTVNGRLFLVNASLGLYPRLLDDREGFKQRFGRNRWVAMVAGVASLLRHYRRLGLHVDQDGEARALHTSTVVVGNNRLQLQQIGMAHARDVEDGKLLAITVKPVSAPSLMWLALRGLSHRLGEADAVTEMPFRRLCIRPRGAWRRRHVTVALDGELTRMHFPLDFRVAPQRLQLLVPSATEEAP